MRHTMPFTGAEQLLLAGWKHVGYAADIFQKQRMEYFAPLIEVLGLRETRGEDHEMYGFIEAAGSIVAIRFEHDRGLCEFSVGAVSDPSRHWSASVIAGLFPRIRVMQGGEQRLSLSEQAQMLRAQWTVLEQLFAPAQLQVTLARLQAEVDRSLTRLGMKPVDTTLEGDIAEPPPPIER
jgi:hypothetical protein